MPSSAQRTSVIFFPSRGSDETQRLRSTQLGICGQFTLLLASAWAAGKRSPYIRRVRKSGAGGKVSVCKLIGSRKSREGSAG